jgi:hypothetical protein
MNKKPSTRDPHNESIQTTYPTRHLVELKDVDDINDRCANWEGTPVATTRIFHPFEYWVHEKADIEYGFADGSTDSRTIKDGRFTQPVVALGWLRDWAMGLFRQVRGP